MLSFKCLPCIKNWKKKLKSLHSMYYLPFTYEEKMFANFYRHSYLFSLLNTGSRFTDVPY